MQTETRRSDCKHLTSCITPYRQPPGEAATELPTFHPSTTEESPPPYSLCLDPLLPAHHPLLPSTAGAGLSSGRHQREGKSGGASEPVSLPPHSLYPRFHGLGTIIIATYG